MAPGVTRRLEHQHPLRAEPDLVAVGHGDVQPWDARGVGARPDRPAAGGRLQLGKATDMVAVMVGDQGPIEPGSTTPVVPVAGSRIR